MLNLCCSVHRFSQRPKNLESCLVSDSLGPEQRQKNATKNRKEIISIYCDLVFYARTLTISHRPLPPQMSKLIPYLESSGL